jgi:hypothetical protein
MCRSPRAVFAAAVAEKPARYRHSTVYVFTVISVAAMMVAAVD